MKIKLRMLPRKTFLMSFILGAMVALALLISASLSEGGTQRGSKDLGDKGEILIPALDVKDAEITNVLRIVARQSGLNIVAGEEIKGKITIYLEDVTVEEALRSILYVNGYGYICEGNVVKVVPAAKVGEDVVRTVMTKYHFEYLNANDMVQVVQQMIGDAGKVAANVESNCILIEAIPERMDAILLMLDDMDKKWPQVMIEAKLVECSLTAAKEIGINWTYNSGENTDEFLENVAIDAAASRAIGAFQWGIIRDTRNFNGVLNLYMENGDVKVLADPSILALDNREATIRIVDAIPYVETTSTNTGVSQNVAWRETGIELKVTPHITKEGFVQMRVAPNQKIAGPRINIQETSAFTVNERSAVTDLIVKDGIMVIIGGLKKQDETSTVSKIPFFGNIPLLGYFFRRINAEMRETELMLFITPHIIKDEILTEKDKKELQKIYNLHDGKYGLSREEKERIEKFYQIDSRVPKFVEEKQKKQSKKRD